MHLLYDALRFGYCVRLHFNALAFLARSRAIYQSIENNANRFDLAAVNDSPCAPRPRPTNRQSVLGKFANEKFAKWLAIRLRLRLNRINQSNYLGVNGVAAGVMHPGAIMQMIRTNIFSHFHITNSRPKIFSDAFDSMQLIMFCTRRQDNKINSQPRNEVLAISSFSHAVSS